jgi:hypothetical protein
VSLDEIGSWIALCSAKTRELDIFSYLEFRTISIMEVRLGVLGREVTLSCSKPTPQLKFQSLCQPLAARMPLSMVDTSHKFKMRMKLRARNDGCIVIKLNFDLVC